MQSKWRVFKLAVYKATDVTAPSANSAIHEGHDYMMSEEIDFATRLDVTPKQLRRAIEQALKTLPAERMLT